MNNRKPTNKRGKKTRQQWIQEAPEAKVISVKGQKIPNPAYPGKRKIVHHQVPPPYTGLWGQK